MRIALDATYSVGPALSGVGVYSRRLLDGLAEMQPEQQFLHAYRPHRLSRGLRVPHPANVRSWPLLDRFPTFRAALFHGLNQRLPRWRPRRTVTTFHDLFVLTGEYSTPEFRQRFSEQARAAARESDLVIAVSHFTARQVIALLGVEASRLRVVPHGVDMPAVVVPLAQRERMVLHVGAIQTRKNLLRVVGAFERMPAGWRLVLAGGMGFGAEQIVSRITASPRRADISLAGYVSDAERTALYQRARVLAFPSLDEGFGIPVLEAMAHGLPVLTSNGSALAEVAGGAAMLVDATDEAEIAGTMRRLAEQDDYAAELVQRGRAHAATMPWSAAVSATGTIYRELLP